MTRRSSIRVRFALWTAGLLFAALVVFGVLIYVFMARSLASAVDDSLALSAAQAVAAINVEDGQLALNDAFPDTAALEERGLTIRIIDLTGHIRQASGQFRALPLDTGSVAAALAGRTTRVTLPDPRSRDPVRFQTTPLVEAGQVRAVVQVAQSLDTVMDTLERLLAILLVSIPALVILAGAGGYWLAARALAPIDAITRTAQQISAADLHARLELPPTDDEVGRLATTFDAMLVRLDESFCRERQFTADASHELRTPLTAMQAILSVTRERLRTTAEYEQSLDDLSAQTQRLRGLVEDLLRLARTDTHPHARVDRVDLAALVGDVVETMRPLAEEKGLALTLAPAPEISILADYDDLIRLVLNLLDNAIKYTDRGEVSVVLCATGDAAELVIADTGIGIAPSHLPHIFERFYRADPARAIGGTGLGLALAQAIVTAQGGQISAQSTPGAGTSVRVVLPLQQPPTTRSAS